jgi:uncharacterized protein (TIGR03086 family)
VSDAQMEMLERCLQDLHDTIAGVSADQHHLPTPCSGWDVKQLVQHVIGASLRNFAARVRQEDFDPRQAPDEVSEPWITAYDARAEDVRVAWHEADPDAVITAPVIGTMPLRATIGQQLSELLIHRWDLAQATGQSVELDAEAAEFALDWSHGMLKPEARGEGKPFGLEVTGPDDAPVSDRFVAWFGRDPDWSPELASR